MSLLSIIQPGIGKTTQYGGLNPLHPEKYFSNLLFPLFMKHFFWKAPRLLPFVLWRLWRWVWNFGGMSVTG